ncbi:MAG TPA: hypothetical protein VND19_07945 [Acetobacteraceae bacterium]|nr:hypothetical protein [Acetobacteraceae bacterium]
MAKTLESGQSSFSGSHAARVYIGSDLVVTGKIDRHSIPIDARNHQVTFSGRGITRNLADCSADLLNDPGISGGQINGANALDGAAKLCKAYGITVRSAVSDLGIAIPSFQVKLGETPYQIIESVVRYAGYLVYEDVFGRLVLETASAPRSTPPVSLSRAMSRRSTGSGPPMAGFRPTWWSPRAPTKLPTWAASPIGGPPSWMIRWANRASGCASAGLRLATPEPGPPWVPRGLPCPAGAIAPPPNVCRRARRSWEYRAFRPRSMSACICRCPAPQPPKRRTGHTPAAAP